MAHSSVGKIIRAVLDVFAPPSERELRVREFAADDVARAMPERSPDDAFIQAVCDYRQEKIQEIVKAAKYDGSRAAARLMGGILAEELLEFLADQRVFASEIVITPVPLSREKETKRGFNQSERISRALAAADRTDTTMFTKTLAKTRPTQAQSHLPRTKRLENVRGSMQLAAGVTITGKTVVVIDDVTTTGATFQEARRALLPAKPEKVLALAFAH